jgi:hypothetical protein
MLSTICAASSAMRELSGWSRITRIDVPCFGSEKHGDACWPHAKSVPHSARSSSRRIDAAGQADAVMVSCGVPLIAFTSDGVHSYPMLRS